MNIRNEKGLTGIDISISIVIITVFIALIANLIANININSKETNRKTIATSYAVQEIEKVKGLGYVEDYEDKGIANEEILRESEIPQDNTNKGGYYKTVLIKDYTAIPGNEGKKENLVKEITVKVSYKVAGKDREVAISTYVTKE